MKYGAHIFLRRTITTYYAIYCILGRGQAGSWAAVCVWKVIFRNHRQHETAWFCSGEALEQSLSSGGKNWNT
jgi:hypothetical protein